LPNVKPKLTEKPTAAEAVGFGFQDGKKKKRKKAKLSTW
jgi:hypothetical protein